MSSGVITLLRGCSFFLVFVLACVVTTEPSTELSCSLRHNDDRALTNKSEQCPTIPNTDWMTRVDLIKLPNCQFLFQCMSLCKAGKSVKKNFNSIKIKDQLCRKPCHIAFVFLYNVGSVRSRASIASRARLRSSPVGVRARLRSIISASYAT